MGPPWQSDSFMKFNSEKEQRNGQKLTEDIRLNTVGYFLGGEVQSILVWCGTYGNTGKEQRHNR